MRASYPTQVKGNGTLVQQLEASKIFCRLAAVMGQNAVGGADLYIQIHEKTAAEIGNGDTPLFAFLSDAGRAFAFAMPNPVELSKCVIVASSTLDSYTASAGTPVTIQALLAV
jgi:hypothetical protein